ncbi:MAG: FHA domain-containing protein [Candidatus Eisenbacteria bacterium]|nr:FHA domain-containing protein [Candidatus Eisenbacteria bacterium]
MSEGNLLKLRLSLMGRPVRNYTFDKPVISIGRDPGSDVFVDNPGVSRDHFRLEKTPGGEYQLVDLGSANGTFVNDQMVHTAVVKNNDVVRFGKYTLWVGYDTDRRAGGQESRKSSVGTEQHTMVLSRAELGNLLETSKEREVHPVAPPAGVSAAAGMTSPSASHGSPVAAIVVSFLLGAALGAGAVWLLLSR